MAAAKLPFGELMFLYVGTSDFEADLTFYQDVLKAEKVWQFANFGARVAAFRMGIGPLVPIATIALRPALCPSWPLRIWTRPSRP